MPAAAARKVPTMVETFSVRQQYGEGSHVVEMPAIVDKVLIPKDLPSGKYVVSWRWDCEQTAQIWAGCGDVLVSGGSPAPPTPPSPPPPIAAKCLKWLNTECGRAQREGMAECMRCTGEHALVLKLAHCAETDFETYCKPRPVHRRQPALTTNGPPPTHTCNTTCASNKEGSGCCDHTWGAGPRGAISCIINDCGCHHYCCPKDSPFGRSGLCVNGTAP
jgi:hypothetical protein